MDITVIAEKQMIGLKTPKGKNVISLKAYEFLANTLFERGEKRGIFAHILIVLDWCLMKRAENCVNTKINHILFHGNCLVFEFEKYKGHQKGEKHLVPLHVYANLSKMWLCPVLSLSRYLSCYLDALKDDVPLFEGKSYFKRYALQLTNIVK